VWIYTGNKSAKFHGNILSLIENIAKSCRGATFLTHTVYRWFGRRCRVKNSLKHVVHPSIICTMYRGGGQKAKFGLDFRPPVASEAVWLWNGAMRAWQSGSCLGVSAQFMKKCKEKCTCKLGNLFKNGCLIHTGTYLTLTLTLTITLTRY